MKGTERKIIVQGKEYTVWSDYKMRATYAKQGYVTKVIRSNGYLSNELSVRKAIAAAFGLTSFRK